MKIAEAESFRRSCFRLLPLALLALGVFAYVLPATDYFTAVPGELADSRFNSVILEHVYRWLRGEDPSLWSPPFFYPFEHILGFSDNHFGTVPVYIIVRALGLSREVAFDCWFAIAFVANFFAAFWAFRILQLPRLAAAIGAFVFTFALPVLHLEIHAQLMYRFASPLAYAFFWRFLQQRNIKDFVFAGFWVVIQFFCAIYLGVFLGWILIALLIAWLIVCESRGFWSGLAHSVVSGSFRHLLQLSVLALLSVAALLWLMSQYISIMNEYDLEQPLWQVIAFLPQVFGYVTPGDRLFFGYGVGLLFVIGIGICFFSGQKHVLGRTAIIAFCIIFVFTGSAYGKSIYSYLISVPGITAIRAVSRVVIIMSLPLAIVVAIAANQIWGFFARHTRYAATLSMTILVPLISIEVFQHESWNTPIATWRSRQEAVLSKLPEKLDDRAILMVNGADGDSVFFAEVDGMIAAQELGIPTLNGYSGSFPPGYIPPDACQSPINRLLGYAKFKSLDSNAVKAIADNIVIVSPQPCAGEVLKGFLGHVSNQLPTGLKLEIGQVVVDGSNMTAEIHISNSSDETLYTYSLSGLPVRLSWRLMPVDISKMEQEPGWDTRVELGWALEPGQRHKMTISMPAGTDISEYELQVSLVQEGYAWFHNLGMNIGRYALAQAKGQTF